MNSRSNIILEAGAISLRDTQEKFWAFRWRTPRTKGNRIVYMMFAFSGNSKDRQDNWRSSWKSLVKSGDTLSIRKNSKVERDTFLFLTSGRDSVIEMLAPWETLSVLEVFSNLIVSFHPGHEWRMDILDCLDQVTTPARAVEAAEMIAENLAKAAEKLESISRTEFKVRSVNRALPVFLSEQQNQVRKDSLKMRSHVLRNESTDHRPWLL